MRQNTIPATHLEETVSKTIIEFVSEPKNLIEMFANAQKNQDNLESTINAERKTLNNQLGATKRQIANIANAIAESGHSQTLLSKLQHLEFDQADIISKLAQLKEQETTSAPRLSTSQIKKRSAMLAKRFQTKDPIQLRQYLLSITEKIIVDRNGQEVDILITFFQQGSEKSSSSNMNGNEEDGESSLKTPENNTMSLFPASLGAQYKKLL